MLQNIIYKEAEQKDVDSIFLLIKDSFDKYVAVDYSEEGIKEFYRHINPANLLMRINEGYFTCIATYNDKIIGIIQLRDLHHISLFFTAQEWQGKGIGKELLKRTIEKCRELNKDVKVISVNASPFSVEIYGKLGFKRQKFEQCINGIRFTPMELIL